MPKYAEVFVSICNLTVGIPESLLPMSSLDYTHYYIHPNTHYYTLPVNRLAQITPKTHTYSYSSTICLFFNGFPTGIPVTFRYISTW